MHRVERVIEIDAPLERVFDLFGDFENFPRWMRHIKEARRTGRRFMRWRADAPLGMDIEWETEITIFEPDRRIAWRSVRGDVDTDGEVVFTELDPHTTRMRLVLGYAPPAGRLGDAFARLFGRNPEAELDEDLQRFKRIAERRSRGVRRERVPEFERQRAPEFERRHVATGGQAGSFEPARPRRRAPREPRSDEHYYRDVLGMRGRDAAGPRAAAPPFDERVRAERDAPYRRDARYHEDGELERERQFNEALQAARRSQVESLRRYQAEHGPAPGWRRMLERERALEREASRRTRAKESDRTFAAGREPRRQRREEERRTAEVVRPDGPRYALTPRERERAEDNWDRETRPRVLRRGVDRLLDEGPSHDWRRWE